MVKTRSPIHCRLPIDALDSVHEIERESNRPSWPKEVLGREFELAHSRIYGSRLAGQLVAYLICHVVLDEAHIVNFGVRTSIRGNGVGRALLGFVLDELNQEAVTVVTLEVREQNFVARSLYDAVGFNESGIRRAYYTDNGESAIMMRLDVRDYSSRQLSAAEKS